MAHFNRLSSAEDERLALLLEEMGEAIQIIGKIQEGRMEDRHKLLTRTATSATIASAR